MQPMKIFAILNSKTTLRNEDQYPNLKMHEIDQVTYKYLKYFPNVRWLKKSKSYTVLQFLSSARLNVDFLKFFSRILEALILQDF
jgi:hypothetical protein